MAVEYICVINCYPTYDVNVDNSIIRMTEEAYPVPY